MHHRQACQGQRDRDDQHNLKQIHEVVAVQGEGRVQQFAGAARFEFVTHVRHLRELEEVGVHYDSSPPGPRIGSPPTRKRRHGKPCIGMPLHDMSSIEVPEQIGVHLPLAGTGSREWAFTIDLLWQSVPIVLAVVALLTLVPEAGRVVEVEEGQPTLSLAFRALLSLVVFLVDFGSFAFCEIIRQDQTSGKRQVGLRVVKDGGHPLAGRAALICNLLRVVDFLPANSPTSAP